MAFVTSLLPTWFLELPLLTVAACLVLGYYVVLAGLHRVRAMRTRSALEEAEEQLQNRVLDNVLRPEACCDPPGSASAFLRNLRSHLGKFPAEEIQHPTHDILRRVAATPGLLAVPEVVPSWVEEAIDRHIGELWRSVIVNYERAPIAGILGTVLGLILAASGYQDTGDQSAMLRGVSLALVTTFLGSVAVLVEMRTVHTILNQLHRQLVRHGAETANRLRLRLYPHLVSAPRPLPAASFPGDTGRESSHRGTRAETSMATLPPSVQDPSTELLGEGRP